MKRLIISCMIACFLLFATSLVTIFSGCGPVLDPEEPVFLLEIDLPTNEKSTAAELTVHRGRAVILPVTLVSTRDETIEVSLMIDLDTEGGNNAQAITFSVPDGYIKVPAGESMTVEIVYEVGETVTPGLYHTILSGNLREPVEGQAGMARAIDVIVTDDPPLTIPPKYPPAYFIEAQFPPNEDFEDSGLFSLAMEPGSSVTLPVNITSWSNVPIHVRLSVSAHPAVPDFVTFETQQEYVTLEPDERTQIPVTLTIAKAARPGEYRMSISGELKEPVEERSTMGQGFTLVITDS